MTANPQLRLLTVPMVGVMPMDLDDANRLLLAWQHKLGPCYRPFRTEAFALEVDGVPAAIAMSASIVSTTVAGFRRNEVVELARCCAAPTAPWANRVMFRLWREVCAQRWACWPVKAAISYHHQGLHTGDLYRFDGWTKEREDCGSSGGGAWSRKRDGSEAVAGKKTLWVWRYA